jgi:ribosome-associated protein
MAAPVESVEEAKIAAGAANKLRGKDILAIDVSQPLAITDVFVLVTAGSNRQVLAIAEEVEKQMSLQCGLKPRLREGLDEARWVLLDFGDIVVHVMDEQSREFYSIEKLWGDCPRVELELEHVENSESDSDGFDRDDDDPYNGLFS